jgi:NAD(P)-dependent dehydrogenase (short-subunit alcohol dehydrogenase family)
MASSVDLLDDAAAGTWAGEVARRFGVVDTVLHLVGGYKGGTAIAGVTVADWNGLQEMLVATTLNVARGFVEQLKASGRGRFVAVTSPKARAPTARSALYAMAKAASDALVMALADELRGTGSTANLVEVDAIDAPEARAAAEPVKPYGKTTSAEQIASAMVYLCSEDAAAINGIRLALTGRG